MSPSHVDPQSAPLDDDQFDELLHNTLQEDDFAAEDLDLDAEDAEDLAIMRSALSHYKSETLRFAEQQSAAMPVPRERRIAALWHGTPRWAMAATAVAALGVATVAVTHHGDPSAPVAMAAAAPTAQVLRDDNRLLLSVDQALNITAAAPSEEELGLNTIPAHNTKRGRTISN